MPRIHPRHQQIPSGWFCGIMLAAICSACLPAAAKAADAAKPDDAFAQQVGPFLKHNCTKCHGADTQKGGLSLHDIAAGKDIKKWKGVLERLSLNEMPPAGQPRPDSQTTVKVMAWIKGELQKSGEKVVDAERKLSLPGQGNRVDHDALFSGDHKGPAASPPRVWRMSPQVYAQLIPRIAGPIQDPDVPKTTKIPQAFSLSAGDGFKDYAGLHVIDEPTIGQLLHNAKLIVNFQVSSTNRGQVKEFLPLVSTTRKPTEAENKAALRRQFQLALLREPTSQEMDKFLQLLEKNIKDGGQVVGAKGTLATVLLLPDALYRVELGNGKTDEHGRLMLAPRELAFAIAYALTDLPPDATLLAAADKGKLASADDVRREVRRILGDKQIAKPRVMRFFEEYFEFPEAEEVFKDLEKFVWQPSVLIDDTRHLIQHTLDQDRNVLKELLTTNKAFVNYSVGPKGRPEPARDRLKDRLRPDLQMVQEHYNEIYGLPKGAEWSSKQPITLPADQRAGILTQPSWLAAFATNNETHPIHRGKWVRERLFGGVIPDLPITVDAKLPDAPHKTMRVRMDVTKQEYCWQCHQNMNPLGLAFEHYDFLGRFRKAELVVDPKGPAPKPVDTTKRPKDKKIHSVAVVRAGYMEVPLDSTGDVAGSGDPKLDGAFKDIVELMKKAGDSPRVRQVFIRHAFRYWMGRNETLDDSPTLMAADKAYVDSNGSMKTLIAVLLSSDSFIYRKVATRPKEADTKLAP